MFSSLSFCVCWLAGTYTSGGYNQALWLELIDGRKWPRVEVAAAAAAAVAARAAAAAGGAEAGDGAGNKGELYGFIPGSITLTREAELR